MEDDHSISTYKIANELLQMKHSFIANLEESSLSRSERSIQIETADPSTHGIMGTSYQKVDQLSLTGQAQNQFHQTTAMARVFTISETGIQMPEHPEHFNALLDSGASKSFVNSNNLVLSTRSRRNDAHDLGYHVRISHDSRDQTIANASHNDNHGTARRTHLACS